MLACVVIACRYPLVRRLRRLSGPSRCVAPSPGYSRFVPLQTDRRIRTHPSEGVVKGFMSEMLIRVGYAAAVTGLVGVVAVAITMFGA